MYLFKCLLVGNSGVGKSSILSRLTDNTFTENIIPTIGVDFNDHTYDKTNKFQIWDLSGQKQFLDITTAYFRGAHCIIVVYDVTSLDSFNSVTFWLERIDRKADKPVTKFLVGNKTDLPNRQVSATTAKAYADKHKIAYMETSAKNGINIVQAFSAVAAECLTFGMATGRAHITADNAED